MKFLLVVAAVVAVSVAGPAQRNIIATPVVIDASPVAISPVIVDFPLTEDGEVIDSPVDISPVIVDFPLTEDGEVIDSPVDISPVIIDFPLTEEGEVIGSPVSIEPAIIDFPLTETGEVITPAEAPVAVSPVGVGPAPPTQSSPLVQLIINVNTAQSVADVIAMDPSQAAQIPRPEPDFIPEPVVIPQPIIVPEPIQIVDNWPVVAPAEPVAPVIINPIFPSPVAVLPEELN